MQSEGSGAVFGRIRLWEGVETKWASDCAVEAYTWVRTAAPFAS